MTADLVVRNIGAVMTPIGPAPRRGSELGALREVTQAALVVRGGRLAYVGPEAELPPSAIPPGAPTLDAGGATIVPGFLAGASYRQIAAAGGGIVRTVAATRAAGTDVLTSLLRARLDEMLVCGTTSAEVKSGYGLETQAEIRSLEAIHAASESHPVHVVPTFLGAHEVPPEHRADRGRYLDLLVSEMIPEVARRGLAVFADVFCEEGVFTVAESRRVLEAARAAGLDLRVHADELAWTGGAELAAELGARSADHLLNVSEEGMSALARAKCAATLLPSAAFYLRLGYAPARALVEAGVPVALATDGNPGGGLSPSMPFVVALACFGMGLSLEEALTAATLNGAYSLGIDGDTGSLEPGKRADFVVLRSARLLDLVRVGIPAVATVVKDGRVVVRDGVRAAG
jgi:imidazolonepropionase